LLTEDALYARLNTLGERIDVLVTRLNQGEGTAGRLAKTSSCMRHEWGRSELPRIIGRSASDPKKYLNVKVSLF